MTESSSKQAAGDTSYLRSPSFWVLGFIGFSIGAVFSFKILRGINPAMTVLDAVGEMLFFGMFISCFLWLLRLMVGAARYDDRSDQKIEALEKKAEEEPDKARPAWDLARATLEKYFQRNLNQVRMIFYVAVGVMMVGFCFVLWGIRVAILNPDHVNVAIIASASGVITQFIGLTFMTIYRSTMLQATGYMSILERINTVGMAVQILDSIKDEAGGDLKDTTRVDIIRLLLATPSSQMTFKPRTRKSTKTPPDKNTAVG